MQLAPEPDRLALPGFFRNHLVGGAIVVGAAGFFAGVVGRLMIHPHVGFNFIRLCAFPVFTAAPVVIDPGDPIINRFNRFNRIYWSWCWSWCCSGGNARLPHFTCGPRPVACSILPALPGYREGGADGGRCGDRCGDRCGIDSDRWVGARLELCVVDPRKGAPCLHTLFGLFAE